MKKKKKFLWAKPYDEIIHQLNFIILQTLLKRLTCSLAHVIWEFYKALIKLPFTASNAELDA